VTPPEKLAAMANQIALAFVYKGDSQAAAAVTDHLVKFWAPRMRDAICNYLAEGGDALSPVARRAVEDLKLNKAA